MADNPASSETVWIWEADLDCSEQHLGYYASLLSERERERVQRFRVDIPRRRYTASAAILRLILASYLPVEPNRIAFDYGPHGKPRLRDGTPGNTPSLHFNVSHTGRTFIAAVSRHKEVGVDVEDIGGSVNIPRFVKRHFTASERTQIEAVPADRRALMFFCWWTRKEALLKGLGLGLSIPLNSFEAGLSVIPATPVRWIDRPSNLSGEWSVLTLQQGPSIVTSLAFEGPTPDIVHHRFETRLSSKSTTQSYQQRTESQQ